MTKVAVGCDHGGFVLKEAVVDELQKLGAEVVDFGCFSTDSVDYPEYGLKVANAVAQKRCDLGVVMCGTGIGISIAANKVPGIRCCCASETYSAKYTRLHNNANVLAMGGKIVGEGIAFEMVDIFLSTEFEGGRHQRRVDKITAIEENR